MPTAKASFTTQTDAQRQYLALTRSPSLDLDEIRLHGKVVTLICRDFGLLIHITNRVFQPLAKSVSKITIMND